MRGPRLETQISSLTVPGEEEKEKNSYIQDKGPLDPLLIVKLISDLFKWLGGTISLHDHIN